ncbi:nhaA [Wigglesworthia glossinidia endosymbiont of Glossina brevipalpis]|uniref:Na(+)/H(+) antiporter NhaA n=1 Tax=Wigglesworthia glossinidia brevipalpis TaxID=36870 RepID=NHAA_WIGBR|nr:RecName: Full=Na(+)/H(+) antiporter NhaA; AltName: Full=Sodium/proton antiporter NhaA [Wigglesworthia glossinidia endosymbiont of Glossina brevipalpis]BAC24443.1 nhaA [Wigglesworthia glossinidia endosymbiont of Glossina brevipalpis]
MKKFFICKSKFFKNPTFSGLLLILFCFLAIFISNTNFWKTYNYIINYPLIKINTHDKNFSLTNIVNDILMTFFFLEIGIEIKHEMLVGSLKNKSRAILPGIAAIGGMIFPALIYNFITKEDSSISSGWAITVATDIAFAVGVLKILGHSIPHSLLIFLLSLAIFDDIGAILIIAFFYSNHIDQYMILLSTLVILTILSINYLRVTCIYIYIIFGILLWESIFLSGIHSTISGVILGILMPHSSYLSSSKYEKSMAFLKKSLSFLNKYFILPIFAFFNSGINFSNFENLSSSLLPFGIFFGLVLGKPIGVFLFSYLSVKFKLSKLPVGISFKEIAGISFLCGIGFTMSIFISNLAFQNINEKIIYIAKFSILISSIVSSVIGFLFLYFLYKKIKLKN